MSLSKKLMMKPDMRVGVLNAPEDYLDLLGELPPGATLVTNPEPGSLDLILLFAKSLAELELLAQQAISLVKYDGLFWIAYPKKSSKIKTDIDRDTGWAKMSTIGYAGVAMVSMNDIWSAMRYRPAERVGK
ncbi:MAG TPA: hypothetical protein VD973_24950 [Symbiobacteriaceae bacterium]|jgi:hypothetical protein|nr:hypothetical protein [Symbiobacteriaceae bacterium]